MDIYRHFIKFKYIFDFHLHLSIKKQYKPKIYVFWDDQGKWYWDFGRSFDRDSKNQSMPWFRGFELFGPFDTETDACADWLKGCKCHQYQIPWPVIIMGRIRFKKWRPIYGSWKTGIGHLG